MRAFGRSTPFLLIASILVLFVALLVANDQVLPNQTTSLAQPDGITHNRNEGGSTATIMTTETAVVSSQAVLSYPYPGPTTIPPDPKPLKAEPCLFNPSIITPATSEISKNIIATEPNIIYDHTNLGIAEWLPDSRKILISRFSAKDQASIIELVDAASGVAETIAIKHDAYPTKPRWLASEQAVAYVEFPARQAPTLFIGRTPAGHSEAISAELASVYIAASSSGDQIFFFQRGNLSQPVSISTNQGAKRVTTFAQPLMIDQPPSPAPHVVDAPAAFRAAPSPDGSLIALFSRTGLYLFAIESGKLCLVPLDTVPDASAQQWATNLLWSPDSRSLAVLLTTGSVGRLAYVKAATLEVATGAFKTFDIGSQYAYEAAWSPDSRTLMLLASVEPIAGYSALGLFALDTTTGAARRLLPDWAFRPGPYGFAGGGLAWSPDGRLLAVNCPDWQQVIAGAAADRLCVIEVSSPGALVP